MVDGVYFNPMHNVVKPKEETTSTTTTMSTTTRTTTRTTTTTEAAPSPATEAPDAPAAFTTTIFQPIFDTISTQSQEETTAITTPKTEPVFLFTTEPLTSFDFDQEPTEQITTLNPKILGPLIIDNQENMVVEDDITKTTDLSQMEISVQDLTRYNLKICVEPNKKSC